MPEAHISHDVELSTPHAEKAVRALQAAGAGLGSWAWGLEFRVQRPGFRVQGFRVQGRGFRGLGCLSGLYIG